jgi:hypothetical protein
MATSSKPSRFRDSCVRVENGFAGGGYVFRQPGCDETKGVGRFPIVQ